MQNYVIFCRLNIIFRKKHDISENNVSKIGLPINLNLQNMIADN